MPLVALAPPGGSNDLDRYELLFRFAAGGMAEVFVARQRGEGGFLRPVAIKRMLPALAEEPKFVDMFLDEARLAALVQSPYVVPTLDCGKDEEGSPYIVMELVVGVSLSQALRGAVEKRKHVPPAVMAEVIAQTALGLYDAHHARTPTGQPLEIVHRDVSPQNVLIGVDGRARLTDFGVARALERVSRTSTGEVKGKLSYFSPEQARMEHLDQRSDIFALGVVAWEMLALERLFSRDSPMAALQAVLHERIPDVRELNPDIPERLALAVARALERDLSRRYQTARDFADELRAAVGKPATAGAIGAWVEEGGGPRLATFRKKIETAFTRSSEPRTEIEVAVPAERDRSGSIRSGATPTPTPSLLSAASVPESHVVGQLGTIPVLATQEGSLTEQRPSLEAPEPSQTRAIPTRAIRPAGTPQLLIVEDAPEPARKTAPSWAVGAAALAAVAVLGGAGGLYYFGNTHAEPPVELPSLSVPAPTAIAPSLPTTPTVMPVAASSPTTPAVLPAPTVPSEPGAHEPRPRDRTVRGGGPPPTAAPTSPAASVPSEPARPAVAERPPAPAIVEPAPQRRVAGSTPTEEPTRPTEEPSRPAQPERERETAAATTTTPAATTTTPAAAETTPTTPRGRPGLLGSGTGAGRLRTVGGSSQ